GNRVDPGSPRRDLQGLAVRSQKRIEAAAHGGPAMIFQCNDLERALRSPELMPDARAHAERCEHCREQLYLWSEVSRLAPGLHEEWESPSLWPRIEADLKLVAPRRKVIPVWRWALAAAAVVALAVTLLLPWRGRQPRRDFLTEDALRDVQQA